MMNRWVYRIADGQLCMGDGPDPAAHLKDRINYRLIDLPDTDPWPDPRTQRVVDATRSLRPATDAELAEYDAVVRGAQARARIKGDPVITAILQLHLEERQKIRMGDLAFVDTLESCQERCIRIYADLLAKDPIQGPKG